MNKPSPKGLKRVMEAHRAVKAIADKASPEYKEAVAKWAKVWAEVHGVKPKHQPL